LSSVTNHIDGHGYGPTHGLGHGLGYDNVIGNGSGYGLAIPEELVYVVPGADGLVDLVEFIKCELLKSYEDL